MSTAFVPAPVWTDRRHNVFYWSIHLSFTNTVNTILWKGMNQFWCKLAQVVCMARH